MDLSGHYKMMARYNRIANERLYACCAQLDDANLRLPRQGSFGSIHALLNHIMLGDRIWMGRFENPAHSTTPPLNTVLHDDFAALHEARTAEDARIERFFAATPADFFSRELRYRNSMGVDYVDQAAIAVAQMFNHQTHHRGQIHVMLSQTTVKPPSLDVHRIVNP